jgi:hypothetical protein
MSEDRGLAFAGIRQNDLEPASVHESETSRF